MRSPRSDSRQKQYGLRDLLAVALPATIVAFLLSLVLLTGVTAGRLAAKLEPRLVGRITVVVWGRGLESPDAAAARAAERLAEESGVRRVIILEPDESDATVGRLATGKSSGAEEPRLISVSGAPDLIPAAFALERLLQADHLAAVVDDHRGTSGALERQATLWLSLALAFCIAACVALFVVCLMRGGHVVRGSDGRFDLMTRLGATPGYIGWTVGGRIASMAFAGAVFGTVCAVLITFLSPLGLAPLQSVGLPAFGRVLPLDAAWTLCWPILIFVITGAGGAFGAWLSVVRQERRN